MYDTDYRPEDAPWALDMNDMKVRRTVDNILTYLQEVDMWDAANSIRQEFDF